MAKRKTTKTKSRKVVNSTKTKVDGIEFQSVLESQMYTLLREANIKFGYESKKYKTMESGSYQNECWERATRASKRMIDRRKIIGVEYTPDFIADDESWFIECKGRPNESFPIRWKLFKNMLSTWKKPPMIFKPMNLTDCKQVIEILLSKGYGQK